MAALTDTPKLYLKIPWQMIKPTEKSVKLHSHVLDLFSGCGGLGLGFQEAGFPIAGSIDMDRSALETAKFNLHAEGRKSITNSICINGDIRELNPLQILSNATPEGLIVAGGPPCPILLIGWAR